METQVSDQEAAIKAKEEEAARLFSRNSAPPILHLLVVGFHHKKGCQVIVTCLCAVPVACYVGMPANQQYKVFART